MKAIIYINNDILQYAIKKGKNYKFNSIALNAGTIVNGVIIDDEEIIKQLTELRVKVKNTTLVIDSSNIGVKLLSLPKLPKKKMYQVIKNEFDTGYEKEYYYDWKMSPNSQDKKSVLGCSIPVELMDKYIEVFKASKIKLNKVDITTNGIIKYVNDYIKLDNKTALINIVRGDLLISVLFEDGEYRLLKRNRLVHDPGTEQYTSELYSKYASMAQFCKSQKIQNGIGVLYYVGLDSSSYTSIHSYIKEQDQSISVRKDLKTAEEMDYFYPYISSIYRKYDFNLLRAKKYIAKKTDKKQAILTGLLVASVAVVVLPWTYYSMLNKSLLRNIENDSKYITQVQETGTLDDLQEIIDGNEEVNLLLSQLTQVIDDIEMNKLWSSNMIRYVYENSKLESMYYSVWERNISITGRGETPDAVTSFMADYQAEEYSDYLHYKGYNKVLIDGVSYYRYGVNLFWEHPVEEVETVGENIEVTESEDVLQGGLYE